MGGVLEPQFPRQVGEELALSPLLLQLEGHPGRRRLLGVIELRHHAAGRLLALVPLGADGHLPRQHVGQILQALQQQGIEAAALPVPDHGHGPLRRVGVLIGPLAEGYVTGTGAKLFTVAGPVLAYGISASVIYGLILCVIDLF